MAPRPAGPHPRLLGVTLAGLLIVPLAACGTPPAQTATIIAPAPGANAGVRPVLATERAATEAPTPTPHPHTTRPGRTPRAEDYAGESSRGLLQPSSAAPAPSPTPVVPAGGSQEDFEEAAADYLSGRVGRYGFVATDLGTGRTLTYNPGQRCATASLIKLDVLLTLLLQRQDADRALTASEQSLAASMIIESDNEATTQLWGRIGREYGIRAANERFGMTETRPAGKYRWGLSTTTARDQVRLLQNLVSDGPLDPAGREYALALLGSVEPGQDWGISAANPQGEAQLKNGWLLSEGWIITSAGRVRTAGGHDLLMSAVSCQGSSQTHSVESIEHLARLAGASFDLS